MIPDARFDPAPPASLGRARNDAHYAAQLVAAAGVTLLEPDPHFHYSSTTFDPGRAALVGPSLPDGRRVSLDLATLTLRIGDRALPLEGRDAQDAAGWLAAELGRPLQLPSWEMPAGSTLAYGPFASTGADRAALTHWYAASHALLAGFAPGVGTASDIRVWPHHFDIALLVTLQADPTDPEASRSVGIGMTPGDGGITVPYLYVTPWPYPAEWTTPPLPAGRWNVQGWYGAVLEAGELTGQTQVEAFLGAAFEAAAATS